MDQTDKFGAAAVLSGTFILLLLTTQMGVPRDESFYFHAASEYIGWFEQLWQHLKEGQPLASFTKDNIDKHWSYNGEHPVLAKALFGLSHKLFADTLGWLSPMTAMRLPGIGFGALTVSVTYLFGAQIFGRLAGFFAAACLLFQPRFFFHAHLACFDVPITALWVIVTYSYWRSLDRTGWAVASGVLWGLALSTKLNAFFIPVVLVGHWLLAHWLEFGIEPTDSFFRFKWPKIPKAFWAMLVIGPIVFFVLWPRLWHEPIDHFMWYVNFHLDHTHYFVHYFDRNLMYPPFPISFPWIMTFFTVPGMIILAFGYGLIELAPRLREWLKRWRKAFEFGSLPASLPKKKGTYLLLVLNLVFPIALISMPDTPIFGGTKHWMPAMPFFAIFAGFGIQQAIKSISSSRLISKPLAALVLGIVVLGSVGYATYRSHPYGTSYYNEFIGSYRGAADAGMMRQFWGYTSRQALPWLNENAAKNSRIWAHNTTGYAWDAYKENDLLRRDLGRAGIANTQYGLYHHQKAFHYQLTDLWRAYETFAPVHVVQIDGVPLISLYRRPDKQKGDTTNGPIGFGRN